VSFGGFGLIHVEMVGAPNSHVNRQTYAPTT
jgi:hypothetical protein